MLHSARLHVLHISINNDYTQNRRYRGDMIETYKILHGIYDTAVLPDLPDSGTRGNTWKLVKNFATH